jgi:hypothetical protein
VQRLFPWIRAGALAVLALAVLYLAGVPSLTWARRRRRRSAAGDDPTARVAVAWSEVLEDLGRLGVRTAPSQTVAEIAETVAAVLPDAGPQARALARVTEQAGYGRGGADRQGAAAAEAAAGEIATAVRDRITTGRRLQQALHPARVREALPRRTRRTVRHG